MTNYGGSSKQLIIDKGAGPTPKAWGDATAPTNQPDDQSQQWSRRSENAGVSDGSPEGHASDVVDGD
jgi:hypothetical protein